MTALEVVLVLAFTFRLSWLVVQDDLLEPAREKVQDWSAKFSDYPQDRRFWRWSLDEVRAQVVWWLASVTTCLWCVSPYFGAVVVALYWAGHGLPGSAWFWFPALVCLASSTTAVVGQLCLLLKNATDELGS